MVIAITIIEWGDGWCIPIKYFQLLLLDASWNQITSQILTNESLYLTSISHLLYYFWFCSPPTLSSTLCILNSCQKPTSTFISLKDSLSLKNYHIQSSGHDSMFSPSIWTWIQVYHIHNIKTNAEHKQQRLQVH